MSREIEYELARNRDATVMAELSSQLIEAGLRWRWKPLRIAEEIRHADSNALVARHFDEIAGFSIMRFHSDLAHLILLAVTPHWQKRGIGRQLVEWQEKCVRTAGITRIQVEVRLTNYNAQQFYRKLGYRTEQVLPGYYEGEENALRMVRQLRAPVF